MQQPKTFSEHRKNEEYECLVRDWKELAPLQRKYFAIRIKLTAPPDTILRNARRWA